MNFEQLPILLHSESIIPYPHSLRVQLNLKDVRFHKFKFYVPGINQELKSAPAACQSDSITTTTSTRVDKSQTRPGLFSIVWSQY